MAPKLKNDSSLKKDNRRVDCVQAGHLPRYYPVSLSWPSLDYHGA